MLIPRIPEREITAAQNVGLRTTDMQGSWVRYCKWSIDTFGEARAELGGASWVKWATDDSLALAKHRDKQEAAKDLQRREETAYRREAFTFEGWMMHLARTPNVVGAHVLAWWNSLGARKPRDVSAVLAFGDVQRHKGGCVCERCRTVLVVDEAGMLVRRRVITAGELRERRRGSPPPLPADIALGPTPDDAVYAERRAQSIRDLEASDLLAGLGVEVPT